MSWTAIGVWGTGSSTVSSTSLESYGPATTVPIGDVVIASIAVDNTQTTDGSSSLVSSITGPGTNTWVKIGEHTNSDAAAGAGTTISVWRCKVTEAFPASDFWTVNFATAVVAKTTVGYQFRPTGAPVNILGLSGSVSDTDPASMSISGLISKNYLFFRAVASEQESFGFTSTAGWTSTGTNAAGGAADASQSIGAEFLISTATGATSDPTLAASVTNASLMFAVLDEAVSVTTTMVADTGAFTTTGYATNLTASLRMAADVGSYAMTGNAANLPVTYRLAADTASFVTTGYAANVTGASAMIASLGTFTTTGNPATLTASYRMQAESASFVTTGYPVNLVVGSSNGASSGDSRLKMIKALQNLNNRKQAERQAKPASTLPLTTPVKTPQNAVKTVEKGIQPAITPQQQAILDEIAELEAEIAELDEMSMLEAPVAPSVGGLSQYADIAMPPQMGYTAPVVDREEEDLIALLIS